MEAVRIKITNSYRRRSSALRRTSSKNQDVRLLARKSAGQRNL